MKIVYLIALACCVPLATTAEILEWRLQSTHPYADPFNEVTVDVQVRTWSGARFTVPAFWAGGNEWRVRVPAPWAGEAYRLRSICSDAGNASLHNQETNLLAPPRFSRTIFDSNGPVRISADREHFAHANGKPFLWLGDTWWMGFTRRLKWEEFRQLTRDRVAKEFNTVQIVAGLYPDMPAFDERGRGEAGFPWTTNYTRINPEYFDAADKRVEHLAANGLMPCIVGAWGYHLPWLGVERMKKHWRYIVARWGAYPVVWCVAGEAAMPYYLSENKEGDRAFQIKGWTEIARYVQEVDGFDRLITIHPTDYSRSQIEDPKVIDFEMLQTGHSDRASIPNSIDTLRKSFRLEPHMPVINSEVCYEGIGGTCHEDVQRFFVWTSLLSGAAGHTYGANGIWQVNRREQPYGKSPHGGNWGTTPWDEAMKLPGSGQTGMAKKVLERFEWWMFEPHPEWASWDPNTAAPEITWGDWIWFPEGDAAKDAPAATRYFRRNFEVPAGAVTRATLRLAVDDKFVAFLNGQRIGSHNTWRSVREFNVIKRLEKGNNVLAVRAENTPASHANPAGLLCSLEITSGDSRIKIVSDNSWRVANVEQAGWTNVVFDDAGWVASKVAARYGDQPWEKIPDPAHVRYSIPYAAGIAGVARVIYLPATRPVVIHSLGRVSERKGIWFDPITGTETRVRDARLLADGKWKFSPPSNADQDWILIIDER